MSKKEQGRRRREIPKGERGKRTVKRVCERGRENGNNLMEKVMRERKTWRRCESLMGSEVKESTRKGSRDERRMRKGFLRWRVRGRDGE